MLEVDGDRSRMHQQIAAPNPTLRNRRKWRRQATLACLLAIAVSSWVIAGRGPPPIAVTTERAEVRDITQFVSATGKIRPEIEVKISPEVAGEIIEMPVIVGQAVKKGDLLVRIKPDNYMARVKQAEASLSSAEADSLQR